MLWCVEHPCVLYLLSCMNKPEDDTIPIEDPDIFPHDVRGFLQSPRRQKLRLATLNEVVSNLIPNTDTFPERLYFIVSRPGGDCPDMF